MLRNATGEEGSTLVEALVAFAIVSLVVVTCLQHYSEGLRRLAQAREAAAAMALARSELTKIEAQGYVAKGDHARRQRSGFTAKIDISELAGVDLQPGAVMRPYWVEVTVTKGGESRPVASLGTIVMARPRAGTSDER